MIKYIGLNQQLSTGDGSKVSDHRAVQPVSRLGIVGALSMKHLYMAYMFLS